MNIIQAVKSGKPFKRLEFKKFMSPLGGGADSSSGEIRLDDLSKEDVVADDWEVKSVPFEIIYCRSCGGLYDNDEAYPETNCNSRKHHIPIRMREVME